MRAILASLLLVVALFVASFSPTAAGPADDAYTALVDGDYATALKLLLPLARQGDPWAQNNLGVMYDHGDGVPEDDAEAVKWFRLAAEQGEAAAQNNLGLMYDNGQGVPQDSAEAVKWYRLAAEQGNAMAQFNLGYMYRSGRGGTPQDYAQAAKWHRLAAEQGNAGAQYALGSMYLTGSGVAQDFAEAVKWYRLAADQGDTQAQFQLGFMYYNGWNAPKDYTEAVKWFRLAADQGHVGAKSRLAEIQSEAEPLNPLGRRVALVIGNSRYANVPRLPNAGVDATDVSAALERIGFTVTQVQDADYGQMRASLQKFSADADGADMALVYYAGHGFEVENKNYLVPIDARLKSDRDIDFETIPLAVVEGSVSGAKTLSMVILDACRDNPFAVEMALSSPTRSIGRGLSAVEPSGGVLIA